MSATFRHPGFKQSTGYDYSRCGNPTRDNLEETISQLEQGKRTWALSCGMSAINAVFQLFNPGDHILLTEDLYGGTLRLGQLFAKYNIEFEYIDTTDLELVQNSLRPNTRAIFVETPSNPMMLVSNIAAIAQIAHGHNALLIVDNTFLSPHFQKPLTLGADIVVHSGTKYLCGHNDILAGFLTVKDDPQLIADIELYVKSTGANLSAQDAWLMLRSLKTLGIRMERQQENAQRIARWLCQQDIVTHVYYVGLPDHPGYELNRQQSTGSGAMISFKVAQPEMAKTILAQVKIISFAESLGGVESLITYPLYQTHEAMPKYLLERTGLDDHLLRLSVGIEDIEDLLEDLGQAFQAAKNSIDSQSFAFSAPSINFDKIIDRTNTNCLKYDFAVERGYPQGIQPFWVADMDFQAPEGVIQELISRSGHGIFGYTDPDQGYTNTLKKWFKIHHNWDVEGNELTITPGVVFALAAAVRAFTEPEEAVIIQQPVYYPFSEVIRQNNRQLVNSPLIYESGAYHIDFEDFEAKIQAHNVKLFILCSPHNPVGRVWSREELQKLADICLKHKVVIVADEIHHEFTRPGIKHTVLASLSEKIAQNTITCTAPSKTFNLAGLQVSNIFIKNETLRRKFRQQVFAVGYSQPNCLGLFACQAAYEKGEAWLNELRTYLESNFQKAKEFIQTNLPKVHLVEPQSTYLIWLDFRAYGLSDKELDDIIIHKTNLWLDSGHIFGPDGSGFQRINIAEPWAVLEKGLQSLATAFKDI